MIRATSFLTLVVAFGIVACESIRGRPLSEAPLNACSQHPCEGYASEGGIAARCRENRCDIPSAGGRPTFPFWIVVHVPDTSIYAPGTTHVFYSDERGEPAFKAPVPGVREPPCSPVSGCLSIGGLSSVRGEYRVLKASRDVVQAPFDVEDGTSIPVKVVYEPLGNAQQTDFPRLPLDTLFDASRLEGSTVFFARGVPFGRYRRALYPQPPFDAFFPPTLAEQVIASDLVDNFTLGDLDDPTGTRREATITRADGLDGWQTWIADERTGQRVSVIKTLAGTEATAVLHTVGQNDETGTLRNGVGLVLAPPSSWTAVPTLASTLINGSGFTISYPPVPPPVTVNGVVAQPTDGGTLLGYPARVFFVSESILQRSEGPRLLRYATSLSTDERGRFATVLPPGTYTATIEPDVATGYAKARQSVVIDRAITTLTLQPAPRAVVTGRAVLTDGRPLGEAEILAQAAISTEPSRTVPPLRPRHGRAKTDLAGRYSLELDPGAYTFTVIPKAGTGFPRVTASEVIPSSSLELLDIRVPPPTRLFFRLRAPSVTSLPIVRAIVRIFAEPLGGRVAPVEVGSGMTDPDGEAEILLAQEPR